MVAGPADQVIIQADIILVIEGTAINGAYLNDIKTGYIIPTLEYFSQQSLEERDFVPESAYVQYGIVVYHAADCLPRPSSETHGPFSNPQKVITVLDKLDLIGGKGESHANVAEGLATALQCFEDLQERRDASMTPQKHCILVCNSPPYAIPVVESHTFSGSTVEQLANVLQDRGINLSILSSRKIPSLFKLYEKAGGDLQVSQTKNYAKDPRHLVLLKGYSLKERPLSPPPPSQLLPTSSPITNLGSPMSGVANSGGQPGTSSMINQQAPGGQSPAAAAAAAVAAAAAAAYRPNQSSDYMNDIWKENTTMPPMLMPHNQHQQHQPQMPPQTIINTPPRLGMQYPQPGMYNSNVRPQMQRWPMMSNQQPRSFHPSPGMQSSNTQGSALIAQLTTPPTMGINQFVPRLDNNSSGLVNTQQMGMQGMHGNRMGNQVQGPPGSMNMGMLGMPSTSQGQNNTQQNPGSVLNQVQSMPPQQGTPPCTVQNSQGPSQNIQPGPSGSQMPGTSFPPPDRHTIWSGMLEWIEKAKAPNDNQKQTRHVPCQVSANPKDGEPDLKADTWPQKLIMQLMPKTLIGNIGGAYLKNSKSVLFHPQPCEALESLTKVMSSGFAGCVHFTSVPQAACDIKVLILLYTAEKRAYLGFIPNDQAAFVDRLRKVIQQQKSNQAIIRQGQVPGNSSNNQGGMGSSGPLGSQQTGPMGGSMVGVSGGMQQPGQQTNTQSTPQGNIMISQTNTIAMGGGQITQNVVTSSAQQMQQVVSLGQPGVSGTAPSNHSPPVQMSGMQVESLLQSDRHLGGPGNSQQQNPNAGQSMRGNPGMMGGPPQRPPFDHIEAARQHNLAKIQQLKQTLEAAQQQELQYKSQLEIINHMKIQQLQENLHMAQQQEVHYKQMEMTQRQMGAQGMQQNQPPNPQAQQQQQRLMRPGPVLTNNPGLRHLLQQQPQYRQQMLQMQPMGGPRGQQQLGQPTGNQGQPQQYDDVSSFDFLS